MDAPLRKSHFDDRLSGRPGAVQVMNGLLPVFPTRHHQPAVQRAHSRAKLEQTDCTSTVRGE
jgi:hypothetical protein